MAPSSSVILVISPSFDKAWELYGHICIHSVMHPLTAGVSFSYLDIKCPVFQESCRRRIWVLLSDAAVLWTGFRNTGRIFQKVFNFSSLRLAPLKFKVIDFSCTSEYWLHRHISCYSNRPTICTSICISNSHYYYLGRNSLLPLRPWVESLCNFVGRWLNASSWKWDRKF